MQKHPRTETEDGRRTDGGQPYSTPTTCHQTGELCCGRLWHATQGSFLVFAAFAQQTMFDTIIIIKKSNKNSMKPCKRKSCAGTWRYMISSSVYISPGLWLCYSPDTTCGATDSLISLIIRSITRGIRNNFKKLRGNKHTKKREQTNSVLTYTWPVLACRHEKRTFVFHSWRM